MTRHVMLSLTGASAAAMCAAGPRRDLLEVAAALGANVDYAPSAGSRRGWRQRLLGPHVRQAWRLAARTRNGDSILADGEHTGLPLIFFLALRRRRPLRVVIIGHLVSRPWKRLTLAVATRLGIPGVLVLHSVEQRSRVAPSIGRSWQVALVPYQVDTEFWTGREAAARPERPLVLAVGSEHRDYATLAAAAHGLDADVVIAAGSHWARTRAEIAGSPPNVRYLEETLGFPELRELYRSAQVVVVPLHDVPNQSGVTTILEAMSSGVPVVVSATAGQRECVTGPIVGADGGLDTSGLSDRGPHLFGGIACPSGWNGLYVRPGDSAGLGQAITSLLHDADLAHSLSTRARATVHETFSLDRFVAAMSGLMAPGSAVQHSTPPRTAVA